MSWAEQIRIETPEQIDFEFEMAGPGSRAAAQALDWIVKFVWIILGGLLTLLVHTWIIADSPFLAYIIAGMMILLGFLFFVGYDIYYEGFREGQTPGKKYIGIRVIREGGGPIDVRAAAIRNLINIADFLPVGYLLGGIICILNTRGQRLGDMAAGTLVVREQEIAKAKVESMEIVPNKNEHPFTHEQLARLTPQDRHVLESFFQRVDVLDASARERLTGKLYQTYCDKLQITVATQRRGEAEMFDFLISLFHALKISKR